MSDETKNKPALEDNFAELEDIFKTDGTAGDFTGTVIFCCIRAVWKKLKGCNVMLDTVEKKMQILNAKGELEDF